MTEDDDDAAGGSLAPEPIGTTDTPIRPKLLRRVSVGIPVGTSWNPLYGS